MYSKWETIKLAFRAFWRTFKDSEFPGQVEKVLAIPEGQPPAPPVPPPPPKPSGEPLRLLALLQREGRLMDFLMEDIQPYPDVQIGAAVRDIHRQCRKIIEEHVVLEPVLSQNEEEQVTVGSNFEPSAIRLTGNVTGKPPFTGTLKHRGWRVKEIKLAPPAEGQDQFVLMPAEVELT